MRVTASAHLNEDTVTTVRPNVGAVLAVSIDTDVDLFFRDVEHLTTWAAQLIVDAVAVEAARD